MIEVVKFGIVPLVAVLLTESMYRDDLYKQSLEDIPNMQELTKLKSFFNTVVALGSPPITILFYVVSFNLMPKPAVLYLWSAMAFCHFLGNSLKSLYSEDRPYWVNDSIVGASCQVTFGNPSGLMLYNVFFWLSIYLHAYNEVGVRQPRMSVFCTAYIIKMAMTCVGISFLIFMGFSRAYLGVGAYNEVLFGTILGATLALVGHFKVKPLFLSVPESLYNDSAGSKYGVGCLSYIKAIVLGLVLPWIVSCIVLGMVTDRAFHHSHEFKIRQIHAGCTESRVEDFGHSFHYRHFEESGVISIIAGAFCGQWFEYQMFINTGLMNGS